MHLCGFLNHENILTFTAANLSLSGNLAVSHISASANVSIANYLNVNNIVGTGVLTANLFGSMTAYSSRSVDTVYQAASDGFVIVLADAWEPHVGTGNIRAYVDSFSPPTTLRGCDAYVNDCGTITVPVRRGEYYKVTHTIGGGGASFSARWVSLGSGG